MGKGFSACAKKLARVQTAYTPVVIEFIFILMVCFGGATYFGIYGT